MLDQLDFGRTEPIVRVNSVSSGLAEEDLNVILQANSLPQTIMLPKVDFTEELDWVSDNTVHSAKTLSTIDEDIVNKFCSPVKV